MMISIFDDFFTDRKPSVSACDRWRNHRKWTSPSNDMAISNWRLWRCRIILGCLIEQTHFLYSYSSMDVNFHRTLTFSFRFHQRPQLSMVRSIFDDFFTDRKLRLRAFDWWRNRRKWTSPSKAMPILKIRRKFRIQIRPKNVSILESHTHTHACSHSLQRL